MAGICAGGYFAAAAVYLANVVVLAAVRPGSLPLVVVLAVVPIACATMGALVLSEKTRVARWAVVVAAGFSAVHLVGLAYLHLETPRSTPALTLSLQWQLGSSFLLLWLCVLLTAFRLAKRAG